MGHTFNLERQKMTQLTVKVLDGVYDKPLLYHRIKNVLKADIAVVVNSTDIRDALVNKSVQVIWRRTRLGHIEDESRVNGLVSPEDYVALIKQGAGKHLWLYINNEPNGNKEQMVEYFKWLARVALLLASEGYKGIYGNLSAGSINGDWVNQGVFDPILKMCHAYPNLVHLGIHDYTCYSLPYLKDGGRDYAKFDNPAYMNTWDAPPSVNQRWHLFGYTRLMERAKTLGWNVPNIHITEFGTDYMSDVAGTLNGLRLEGLYRDPQYPRLQGYLSLRRLWQVIYPQWTHDQAFAEQIKWYMSHTPQKVKSISIFAYGGWADRGFDIQGRDELFTHLTGINSHVSSLSSHEDVLMSSTGILTNVRSGAGTGHSIVGMIRQRTPVKLIQESSTWHKVLWNEQIAYVSAPHVRIIRSNPITVTAKYTYDGNNPAQVSIHNQIQSLLDALRG